MFDIHFELMIKLFVLKLIRSFQKKMSLNPQKNLLNHICNNNI